MSDIGYSEKDFENYIVNLLSSKCGYIHGNKITKKYLTPHQKCTILRVRKPCTPLMVIYNHNAHPARFFFCLDIISIFKGWPR